MVAVAVAGVPPASSGRENTTTGWIAQPLPGVARVTSSTPPLATAVASRPSVGLPPVRVTAGAVKPNPVSSTAMLVRTPSEIAAVAPAGVTVTPAGATAAISLGVLTSIAVDEAGFGFTAPAVTLTGGNPTLGLEATAVASGGVDDVTLATPGSGYAIQPVVVFSLPELAGGTPATATATMDGAGAVTSITLVTPGSGYTHAPTVTILDSGQVNPTAATATATIGIARIDITSGGQGYESAPAVAVAAVGLTW